MTRADRLAHLVGYAAIVGVLASANWSSPVGWGVALLFVGAVVVYLTIAATDHVRSFVGRDDARDRYAATDGGDDAE